MAAGTRDRWNLFVCSLTILFVELVCIRWSPAYIRYLGYFTNFVLGRVDRYLPGLCLRRS
jgi:hypothetical protein